MSRAAFYFRRRNLAVRVDSEKKATNLLQA
jgi:hypothetical protein